VNDGDLQIQMLIITFREAREILQSEEIDLRRSGVRSLTQSADHSKSYYPATWPSLSIVDYY